MRTKQVIQTGLAVCFVILAFGIVGRMDYDDARMMNCLLSSYPYSEDYMAYIDAHGIEPCDTDIECEEKNRHILEPAGPPAE